MNHKLISNKDYRVTSYYVALLLRNTQYLPYLLLNLPLHSTLILNCISNVMDRRFTLIAIIIALIAINMHR